MTVCKQYTCGWFVQACVEHRKQQASNPSESKHILYTHTFLICVAGVVVQADGVRTGMTGRVSGLTTEVPTSNPEVGWHLVVPSRQTST